jgi:hypothetical protein
MGYKENLMGVGLGAEKAQILGTQDIINAPTRSVGLALTATGTDLATALVLTKLINVVGTTASSTGVALPTAIPIGQTVIVQNNGANALSIYPPTSTGTLNGGSAGAAVTSAAGAGATCIRLSSTDWLVSVTAKES